MLRVRRDKPLLHLRRKALIRDYIRLGVCRLSDFNTDLEKRDAFWKISQEWLLAFAVCLPLHYQVLYIILFKDKSLNSLATSGTASSVDEVCAAGKLAARVRER